MVLNPGSDYGVGFPKEEIQQIIDGTIGQPSEIYRVETDTEVMIGQSSNYPNDLVKSLTHFFHATKSVNRAYLAHYFDPAKDEKPHTLVGIEITGDWDDVINKVGLVCRGIEIPDTPLDFVQITGQGGFRDYFLGNECKPFYKRKKWGLF